MDTDRFVSLFDEPEAQSDFERNKDILKTTLKDAPKPYYYDISGDGTTYVRSGGRNGCGYATCTITLAPDGLVTIKCVAIPVPEQYEAAVRKLFKFFNASFKLKGLKVEDGRVVFETSPFDPATSRFDVDVAASLALSTINNYAYVTLALEAGAEPYDIVLWDKDGDKE